MILTPEFKSLMQVSLGRYIIFVLSIKFMVNMKKWMVLGVFVVSLLSCSTKTYTFTRDKPISSNVSFEVFNQSVQLTSKEFHEISVYIYKYKPAHISGNALSDLIYLIQSGGIIGINAGGNFYGTNIGGTEKNTKSSRGWGVGNKHIIELQDACPFLVEAILNTCNVIK